MTVKLRPRTATPTGGGITIASALCDPLLLGAGLGAPQSWGRWLAVLKAGFALPMSEQERQAFAEVSGNRALPTQRVRELWATVGRRSGKSRVAAALAVYSACFLKRKLARGEVGTVLVLAASQSQARVVFDYALGFLTASPVLARELLSHTSSEIRLRNGNLIAVHPNSYRTVRGKTLICCVFDEVALWRDVESALPDIETYRAILPSLVTTNGLLVGISSPYRKTGLLFQKHRDHFGADSPDTLVVQGASRLFNPTLDEQVISAATEADPEAAIAEWGGEFRADISSFLDEQTLEKCIDYRRPMELPPRTGVTYSAFTDASGGRHDAFTLCIAHREGGINAPYFVCDLIRGRLPPFDPESVVAEYASVLKNYGLLTVSGDSYGAEWVESAFSRAGIRYVRSDLNRSELYTEALPLFMREAINLPDQPKLLKELRLLERRTSRMGRDIVDHGKRGSDDFANSLAGALRGLNVHNGFDTTYRWLRDDTSEEIDGKTAWRRTRAAEMLSAFMRQNGVF